MGRLPRLDFPGALHHVTNRGIAHRTVFERNEDVRYFLSRVARAVRRGEILVYAFCLLTTHFHLLLRSVTGCLGKAMQRIQGDYSRYFNRRRRRDGSMYRGRYFSGLVRSTRYLDNVVRYIDGNAVAAGLVAKPEWHPSASAYWYGRGDGPPWLARGLLEARAVERTGAVSSTPEVYAHAFKPRLSGSFEQWIETRLRNGESPPDPLDDLLEAAPPKVLAWMRCRTRLADGTDIGLALVPWEDLMEALEVAQPHLANHDLSRDRRNSPFATIAQAGLLRDICRLSHTKIAAMVGCSAAAIASRVNRHRQLLVV